MLAHTLNVVAVLTTTVLTGNELAIAAFVHPALWRADDRAHVQVAGIMARALGRAMPPFYAVSLLALGLAAVWQRVGSLPWWECVTAAVIMAGTIALTIAVEVPINNRVGTWAADAPPPEWRADRRRWDRVHGLRVLLLVGVSVLITAAATA